MIGAQDPRVLKVQRDTGMGVVQAIRHVRQREQLRRNIRPRRRA